MAIRTDAFDLEGFNELSKQLDRLLTSDPDMEKRLQGLIRDILKEARSELSGNAASGLQMQSDPRQAYRAIRSVVYRQILGGNVNILRKRKAGAPKDTWLPSSHTGRGGNRRTRGDRTKALQGYWGPDRGFILRFLNSGASNRAIKNFKTDPHRADVKRGSRGGDVSKYGKTVNTGARGNIAARNWFGNAGYYALVEAADKFTAYIENMIAEQFGKE